MEVSIYPDTFGSVSTRNNQSIWLEELIKNDKMAHKQTQRSPSFPEMTDSHRTSIVDAVDTEYENASVKLVFLRDLPETRIGDRVLGPWRSGQELELPFWLASHIVGQGYARFRDEDQLSLNNLSTIHYRETLPASRQLPPLQPSFYFQLRRLIRGLKEHEGRDRIKARELDRALALARDIVNIRVKKIASIAASVERTNELMSNLTSEERILYEAVRQNVDSWKKEILGREPEA